MGADWKSKDVKDISIAFAVVGSLFLLRSIFRPDQAELEAYDGSINPNELTYDTAYYFQLADSIEAAIWEMWVVEDDATLFASLAALYTDSDWYELSRIYGKRCRPKLLCEKETLLNSIIRYLDDDYKDEINALYAERGMTIHFY